MAPSSARQLASPTRFQFSRPFVPSMSAVPPPSPNGNAGICEQPAALNAKAAAATIPNDRRSMAPPPLAASLRRVRDMRNCPSMKPRVAIATGDPGGIGPEISIKAAQDERVRALCEPVVIGDLGALEAHAKACRLSLKGI